MAKAVLVMDMPKDCLHCKLRMCIENRGKYYQHCGLDTDGYCLESFFRSENLKDGFRSEHCPLKPMPENKDAMTAHFATDYNYSLGWNDCLDAIQGKE